MSDVKWIKIVTDIFDDEKIMLIEQLPEHDTLIVIWFKLLCLAGKQNNSGVVMLNERIAYTDEMLSAIFRRPLQTVKMALSVFESYDMIRIIDGVITIPNWDKHQSQDRLKAIKESNAKRVREYRERQKKLASCAESTEEPKPQQQTSSKTNKEKGKCNVTVTLPLCYSNGIDIDIDKDKELDISIYTEIVDFLNTKAGAAYRATTPKTRALIKARMAEGFSVDDFKTVITKKCKSWMGTDYQKFLRPETLFGTKFESYLNEAEKPQQERNDYSSFDTDDFFNAALKRSWEDMEGNK